MIVYKLDRQAQTATLSQIKDMKGVIDEIAPSLQILQKLLNEHRQTISTPPVDTQRAELQQAVDGAIKLTRFIAESSRQLCASSDQAADRLLAMEDRPATVARTREQTYNPRNRIQV